MPERSLSEPRQISGGLALGAGLVAAALVAMRPFVPEGAGPSAAEAFALAVAALLSGTVWMKAVAEGGFVLPPWRVTAPLGALMLAGLAMTAFAVNAWRAELELMSWIAAALGFAAIYALVARHEAEPGRTIPREREGERRLVLSALVSTAGVAAGMGILGAATGVGVPGFLESPNAFASLLAISIPLAAGTALSARSSGRTRAMWTASAIAILAAAALILASSEGACVSAVVGLAAMGVFLGKRRLRGFLPKTRGGRALVLLSVTAVAALALAALLAASESMRNRLEFWRAALAMIADHPLGVGLGNFGDHYWRYRTYAGLDTLDPRSSYLLLAAEAGLPALAVLGALAWGVIRLAAGGDEGETNPTRASKAPPDAEVATEGLLGGFGLIGGATGLVAALISNRAPGSLGGLPLVGMLAVWAAIFAMVRQAGAGGRHVRAGLLGMLAAAAAHSSVESVMSHGGVALAVAAACALALALSGGTNARVGLRGWGGLARSAVFAVAVGLVLWRGLGRQMSLWEKAELAERGIERAVELDLLRDALDAATAGRADRPALRLLFASPLAGLDMAELALAVEASPDAEVARAARDVSARAGEMSLDWLREAWRQLDAYLAVEPADLERALRLVEVDRLLAGKGDPVDSGATVERTLRTLARLSPASFAPWRELGELHASRGNMTQAAAALEEAARRYPTSPGLPLRLGDARVFFDGEGALAAYRGAFENNRRMRQAAMGLFGRLWRTRPRRPGSADFIIALERMDASLGAKPETSLRLALASADYGGYAEARDHAERALAMNPRDPQAALVAAAFAEMAAAVDEDEAAAGEVEAAWRRAAEVQREAPDELRMQADAFAFVAERRDLFRSAAMGMRTR